MAADAGVSLGVVITGIVMMTQGWLWVDSVISLIIVFIILAGTWGLLRDSINLSLDAVPEGIDIRGMGETSVSNVMVLVDGVSINPCWAYNA